MTRPSTYTKAIGDKISARIADGETLRAVCRDPGMPSWRTVYGWRLQFPDFAEQLAVARDMGFDAIAEDTIDMVDERPERTATMHGDKVDAGHVAWQKNRVEQRLKLLAKWSNRYSEKQSIEMSGHLALGNISDDDLEAEIASLAAQIGHSAVPEPPVVSTPSDDCDDLV
jgi:hypothetical protein